MKCYGRPHRFQPGCGYCELVYDCEICNGCAPGTDPECVIVSGNWDVWGDEISTSDSNAKIICTNEAINSTQHVQAKFRFYVPYGGVTTPSEFGVMLKYVDETNYMFVRFRIESNKMYAVLGDSVGGVAMQAFDRHQYDNKWLDIYVNAEYANGFIVGLLQCSSDDGIIHEAKFNADAADNGGKQAGVMTDSIAGTVYTYASNFLHHSLRTGPYKLCQAPENPGCDAFGGQCELPNRSAIQVQFNNVTSGSCGCSEFDTPKTVRLAWGHHDGEFWQCLWGDYDPQRYPNFSMDCGGSTVDWSLYGYTEVADDGSGNLTYGLTVKASTWDSWTGTISDEAIYRLWQDTPIECAGSLSLPKFSSKDGYCTFGSTLDLTFVDP